MYSDVGTDHRERQSESSRAKILAAAVTLIEEKGEAGLRVVEVGALSGMSTASIYTHFDNRDDLVVAVRLEQFLQQVDADVHFIGEVIDTAIDADDLVARMREMSRLLTTPERMENRWRRAEILGAARRRPALAARLAAGQHQVNAAMAGLVKRGQSRGLINPNLDPMAVGILVQAYSFGMLLSDIDTEGSLDPDAWVDLVSRVTRLFTTPE